MAWVQLEFTTHPAPWQHENTLLWWLMVGPSRSGRETRPHRTHLPRNYTGAQELGSSSASGEKKDTFLEEVIAALGFTR